ncbi:hypothetical protein FRC12_017578 [Ceratobasidium sp. 428]|nr:hypothetical protein FRC12_017578 [Ceratobasidium sp. 428]
MSAGQNTHLTWVNVGIGFAFVVVDAVVSYGLGLGVGTSLVSAAIRCVVQLSIMGLVLQSVFETTTPWAVAGISCLLLVLGSFETGQLVLPLKRKTQLIQPLSTFSRQQGQVPILRHGKPGGPFIQSQSHPVRYLCCVSSFPQRL